MKRRAALQVRVRLDFGEAASIGPGKVELLERIADSGSLSQAARELGLSYRRGWLLLADLNRSFGEPIVTTNVGGRHGGGARLTRHGERLVRSYRSLERKVGRLAAAEFRATLADLDARKPREASLRRRLTRPVRSG